MVSDIKTFGAFEVDFEKILKSNEDIMEGLQTSVLNELKQKQEELDKLLHNLGSLA